LGQRAFGRGEAFLGIAGAAFGLGQEQLVLDQLREPRGVLAQPFEPVRAPGERFGV
jgi:hypothetical protein